MDEKLRILKMIEEGTITAEQAAELMSALGTEQEAGLPSPYEKKMLRVIVDGGSGEKVNVQFPVGAVKRILHATGNLPVMDQTTEGVDISAMMDAVSQCLDDEIEGDFVNVTAADGRTVRIFVD